MSLCAMEPRYLGPLFLVRDSGDLLIIKTHRLPIAALGVRLALASATVGMAWLWCG